MGIHINEALGITDDTLEDYNGNIMLRGSTYFYIDYVFNIKERVGYEDTLILFDSVYYIRDLCSVVGVDVANEHDRLRILSTASRVEQNAFHSCYFIKEVILPEGLNFLGFSAFYSCKSLEHIEIPKRVTKIDVNTFFGCKSLEKVIIPEEVTHIEGYAFYGCSNLLKVCLSSSLVSIGEAAFAYCTNLSSIRVPNRVTMIGDRAFYYCGKLELVLSSTMFKDIYIEDFINNGRVAFYE